MNTDVVRTLKPQTCCYEGCGVMFGLDTEYDAVLHRTHAGFYCPNGHRQFYSGKSDVEKAREETENARREAQRLRERNEALQSNLRSERYKVAAERGAKTKLRNRIAHGVCPCCKRTFANVARHMRSKHPDQVK